MIQDHPLVLGCSSCGVAEPVPVGDPFLLRDLARAFFVAHADCETSIDLDDRTLRGWAVHGSSATAASTRAGAAAAV